MKVLWSQILQNILNLFVEVPIEKPPYQDHVTLNHCCFDVATILAQPQTNSVSTFRVYWSGSDVYRRYKGLSRCHDLWGRPPHDPEYRSKRDAVMTQSTTSVYIVWGTCGERYRTWGAREDPDRTSDLADCFGHVQNNRRGRAVSPERGGDAVWSTHERDDNYFVVWRTWL